MIERAILLEGPLMDMIEKSDFEELRKYRLTDADWEVLFLIRNILRVCFVSIFEASLPIN